MSEQQSAENDALCTCLPVPRVEALDGRDGWIHVKDDCPKHGRNRGIPPAEHPPT